MKSFSKAGGGNTIAFDEFARSRQAHLRRAAYLLCGDWHLAEDLVQTSLAKLYAVWHRVHMDSPDGYARRVLFRTFLDENRRRRWWDRPTAHEYDVAAPAQDPELRLTLLAALRQVPDRSRAVLVLRFWEDQSVEETAAALGCSAGTVKSQTSRGLATLRRVLGDTPLTPSGNGAWTGAGTGAGGRAGVSYPKAER
ncbi:SigE family RNA polymerase sigma factor [Streptomyces paludis]|uniref:SigE family RNA polymerase sigma factor n=1 Tax=Streptomyces paludis TaxID=2282738 RepID=A0A345HLH8_9ACTN|nr:SigE family RNA polymerase sigma factor [Streptomyces paludis]AXG77552.1 SigE family RNA polymerase sigma factor [Streptomyces paludis]